jgi:hypothetical protein
MKQPSILLLLVFSSLLSKSQQCNCTESIKYAAKQVEDNVASYQHQVVLNKRIAAYQKHKLNILQQAKNINEQKNCLGLLSRYLFFFRDEHLSIQYNDNYFPSLKDTNAVLSFLANEPRLDYNNTKKNKAIEGKWFFQDGSYSINIIPDRAINRDFAGIMENDMVPLWKKGNVRLELLKINDTSFYCIYWRGTRQPRTHHAILKNNVLHIGRAFTFYRKKEAAVKKNAGLKNELFFEKLSTNTNYLRIPSFELKYSKAIDSIMAAHKDDILLTENLIIDIRNNGGGGDRSYKALMPFIFDELIIPTPMSASIWVSKENFEWYDSTKYEVAETKVDSTDELEYVNKMMPYKGQFVPPSFYNDTLKETYGLPNKIGIITNRWCGSTTEGFTLVAKQSKKVKLYGENTGGMVSYGDWRKIPIKGLPIFITATTKRMVFFNGADIESIGIAPKLFLNAEREDIWIKQVEADMNK